MEVIIVVAIIALVAGAASVAGFKAFDSSQRQTALTDARSIRTAARTYFLNEGETRCPTMETLLTSKTLDGDGRKTDPWKTLWKIECKEGEIYVTSAGRDRTFGNDDDITAPSAQ